MAADSRISDSVTLDTAVVDTTLFDTALVDTAAGDSSVPDAVVTDTLAGDTRVDAGVDVADTAAPCPEAGAKTYLGHCYFPTPSPLSWDSAKAACTAASAHLVSITSPGEQAVVVTVRSGDRWIGLSRPVGSPTGEASFSWVTAEAMTYKNWDAAAGEPNGSGECAKASFSGAWADQACSNKLFAVCERE